jgi:hypothetical protein
MIINHHNIYIYYIYIYVSFFLSFHTTLTTQAFWWINDFQLHMVGTIGKLQAEHIMLSLIYYIYYVQYYT